MAQKQKQAKTKKPAKKTKKKKQGDRGGSLTGKAKRDLMKELGL